MADDQFQYIKLPDGSFGKFAASAKDEDIRAAISKDFPSAFKSSTTSSTTNLPNGSPAPPNPMQYTPERKFEMNVTRGMGLDPDSIAKSEASGGTLGGALDVGGQVLSGAGKFLGRAAMDPFTAKDAVHGMASNMTNAMGLPDKGSAFDPNGYHAPNPGQMLGAGAAILGGAEAPEKAGALRDAVSPKLADMVRGPSTARNPGGLLNKGTNAVARTAGFLGGSHIGGWEGGLAGASVAPTLADWMLPKRTPPADLFSPKGAEVASDAARSGGDRPMDPFNPNPTGTNAGRPGANANPDFFKPVVTPEEYSAEIARNKQNQVLSSLRGREHAARGATQGGK